MTTQTKATKIPLYRAKGFYLQYEGKTIGTGFSIQATQDLAHRCNMYDEQMAVLQLFIDVDNAIQLGKQLLSNQGQALDGFSVLANFRGLASKARELVLKVKQT